LETPERTSDSVSTQSSGMVALVVLERAVHVGALCVYAIGDATHSASVLLLGHVQFCESVA